MKRMTAHGAILALIFGATTSEAYQFRSHNDMTVAALRDSELSSDPAVLSSLGLRDLNEKFPSSVGEDYPEYVDDCRHNKFIDIVQLMACGAQFEDGPPDLRVLNHFYDPTNDQELTVPGLILEHWSSPDWALDARDNSHGQQYSYEWARQYFYEALTTVGPPSERAVRWGKAFQSLGQVMHHLQDMAQPQHVRNDQHVSALIPFLYNPSLFERHADGERPKVQAELTQNILPPVYPGHSDQFHTPRDFWKNASGTGIAKWTNENFVSLGTNFDSNRYQLPQPAGVTDVPALWLDPAIPPQAEALCLNYPLPCVMSFVATNPGTPSHVERASSLSIFDQYLRITIPERVYALNKYNFAQIRTLTMPTAVAYSAGLINYFFRGRLEVSLPNAGVYGVLDHAVDSTKDTAGFRRLKARVRNTTSSTNDGFGNPIIEAMTQAGVLRAVVKYHLNDCYQPDLSGEYGSPGIDWRVCRLPAEQIVISAPVPVTNDINGAGQEVIFDFSANVIPINATDLYLQVVYRGRLGEEADAVAVATKDISEPTYLYNYSRWDQYTYCGYWPVIGSNCSSPRSYDQWCLGQGAFSSVEACNQANGLTYKHQFSRNSQPIPGYDPANPTVPPGTWTDLSLQPPFAPTSKMTAPVGTLTRVAVLLETTPGNVLLTVEESIDPTHGSAKFQWSAGTIGRPTVNQLDVENDTLTPSVRYLPGRGVFLPEGENTLLTSGEASPMPLLLIVPTLINFD